MASPPYNYQQHSAISPPYPSNMSLPQPPKRRQSDMPSSTSPNKRRKGSMLSTMSAASHPLRQTSFPPPESSIKTESSIGGSRSPSFDTMSLTSGVSAPLKKKPRKRKSKTAGNDDESLVGGKARSERSGRSGKSGRSAVKTSARDPSVDEDEEEGGENTAVAMVKSTEEEKKKEKEQRAMLLGAFDAEQFHRYEAWRSTKLGDAVVRRIVNQTLSQSAPASVILAVKSVAKIFAGEMIEGARKVQTQWLKTDILTDEKEQAVRSLLPNPSAEGEEFKKRGPLLPDHLREALRRHKLSGEGGNTGLMGLWQQQASSGVERFGTRMGGKRLFK